MEARSRPATTTRALVQYPLSWLFCAFVSSQPRYHRLTHRKSEPTKTDRDGCCFSSRRVTGFGVWRTMRPTKVQQIC